MTGLTRGQQRVARVCHECSRGEVAMTTYHVVHPDYPGLAFSQACATFVAVEHAVPDQP